jgi:hypothetical protein
MGDGGDSNIACVAEMFQLDVAGFSATNSAVAAEASLSW